MMNRIAGNSTPGPWAISQLSPRHIMAPREPDTSGHRHGVDASPCVAIVAERGETTRGNAALIASAPELFAALSALTEACLDADGRLELPPEIDGSLLDRAARALARAEAGA